MAKSMETVIDSIPEDSVLQDSIPAISCEELNTISISSHLDAATIEAVSFVEAGPDRVGFIKPGIPIVHLEVSMFKNMLGKAGYDVATLARKHPEAFSSPRKEKYGTTLLAQKAQFDSAAAINDSIAKICTYWGMFQIRGSNWRQCGSVSLNDFIGQMCKSEASQLELFVKFITNTGLHRYLIAKDWESFARAYNGKGYAKNRYHIKLEHAYRHFSGNKKIIMDSVK